MGITALRSRTFTFGTLLPAADPIGGELNVLGRGHLRFGGEELGFCASDLELGDGVSFALVEEELHDFAVN